MLGVFGLGPLRYGRDVQAWARLDLVRHGVFWLGRSRLCLVRYAFRRNDP